jgi:hypothetical protein
VIWQRLRLVATGLVSGSLLALLLTRAMQRVLFNVAASDPLTYVLAMLLATTGAAAAWLPATRASATDPAVALRADRMRLRVKCPPATISPWIVLSLVHPQRLPTLRVKEVQPLPIEHELHFTPGRR